MSNYQINQSVVQNLQTDKNTIIDKFNSNRIVSIPQDIVITFDSGVLTLISGSKLYVPNGFESDGTTPKFDIFILQKDVISTRNSSVKEFYMYETKNDVISQWGNSSFCIISSGTTAPTGKTFMCWYDLNDNKIKVTKDSGATWEDRGMSFPFCLATSSDTAIKQVDQLFNGFGYIGSTCYILPGVTGYIPKGLNSDGTLINEIITQTKVSITTVTSSWGTGSETFFFNGVDSYIHRASKNCFYQATQPIVKDVENYWFNTASGKYYETKDSGLTWTEFKAIPAFTITFDNSLITSLKSCGVHELVNSNATNLSDYGREIISGLGKPSDKYIELTLGATNTYYLAPANGWFTCVKRAASAGQYLYLRTLISNVGIQTSISNANEYGVVTIPISKGDICIVVYTATGQGDAERFRFVYDQGCQ